MKCEKYFDLHKLLNEQSYFETYATKQITQVYWPKGSMKIAFTSNSSFLTREQIESKIKESKGDSKKIAKVTIKIIDIKWLFENEKGLLDLLTGKD